jgi:hypothetical protein
MNNVYAVRLMAEDEPGMAVFMVSACSRAQAVATVQSDSNYIWLNDRFLLQDIDDNSVNEYGITSQPTGVMDTYELFLD